MGLGIDARAGEVAGAAGREKGDEGGLREVQAERVTETWRKRVVVCKSFAVLASWLVSRDCECSLPRNGPCSSRRPNGR